MTKDTKELLDKTRRFLIEKRGTMHIKVSNFNINPFSNILFLQGKGDMTTYWLLEELESKTDCIEKNLLYVQPSK